MPIVVISYRRADSKDITRRIHDFLVSRYGKKSVYADIDSIQPAVDYRIDITQHLERALVILAIIGNEWNGPRDKGNPRIFDDDDPVRLEIETALANRRSVMPVLVDGARMPTEGDLPASLQELSYLQATELRSGDELPSHLKRLSRSIDRLNAKFWSLYLSIYLLLPFILLVLADYVILFKLDWAPLLLRIATVLISFVLGIGLCLQVGYRTGPACVTAVVLALASVLGMLTINTALSSTGAFDAREIIPSNSREWQEAIEYFSTIAGVTLGANMLGWAYRSRRSRRRWLRKRP